MAGFNIHAFKVNGLEYGGARPTQFTVDLTFPFNITGASRKAQFTIKAASLPASLIDAVEVGYFGRKIKLNGDRVFQDWTVTVMNDEDFLLRSAFEQWHNSMNTLISNRLDPAVSNVVPASGTFTPSSYKTTALVHQYAKTGPGDESGALRSYEFVGLFPIAIDNIQLDWDATNQIEMFDVTFAYDYYIPYVGDFASGRSVDFDPELNPA